MLQNEYRMWNYKLLIVKISFNTAERAVQSLANFGKVDGVRCSKHSTDPSARSNVFEGLNIDIGLAGMASQAEVSRIREAKLEILHPSLVVRF